MTGVHLTLKTGGKDMAELLDQFIRKGGNLQDFFEDAGEIILPSTKKRMHQEVDPDGKRWTENAPATKKKKKNPKILQEFGERGGLLGTLAYKASSDKLQWGSNKAYAAIHQLGGKAGRGRKVTIPARVYLGLSRADRQELLETLRDYLTGG